MTSRLILKSLYGVKAVTRLDPTIY